ncbi:MAG: hypothetical protein UY81_C0009G0016 [Candidatus Giovannonibacteria bacterium GW2011_GWA2_53_7]|uniref:Uncharacterized protein n=1 Tax=Candidatus Giovannonibacteria bacterium GW2011_GWA2_53_7 TaxID=1618650 RepID=A0A0G1Y120_9BACT|nr:MAG: hypothetical protein UY81_C0009G0016 [Candidatus Giovannonibacteria bacterium GW2011_GWA2_53_7]
MFDPRPLFHLDFWFGSNPTPLMSSSTQFFLIFFTLLLVLGVIVRIFWKKRFPDRDGREIIAKLSLLLKTMGVLGLIWLFFAVEQITFFQGRSWFLVWIAGLLVWSVFVWKYVYRILPKERRRREDDLERRKYLPGKKR